ncbi:MAG: hypothetical protein KGI80_06090 [Verrucomicrobiota bacterium]|nr:hypothetical protein [Verrucomicrobiota bacterium]
MAHPLVSFRKARLWSRVLFLLGLIVVSWTGSWWPGFLLITGFPVALQQYLVGKTYDAWMTLFVFLGAFITVTFDIQWKVVLPVLFGLGAVYILIREIFASDPITEEEKEEDREQEIEEKH